MKKKIVVFFLIMLSLFMMLNGFSVVKVKADAEDLPALIPPSPHP